jgi:hypothetical protein
MASNPKSTDEMGYQKIQQVQQKFLISIINMNCLVYTNLSGPSWEPQVMICKNNFIL